MAYGDTNKKLSKKDEAEVLKLMDDHFQQALYDLSWRQARTDMIQCFDYKENRQWTTTELAELASRGQPPTVNNQVKVTIDRIVGQFVQMKSKTVYKPRNGLIDEPVASAMSDIYSYIRQNSGLEFEERDVMEDGTTGGFGVFDVAIEDNDILGQEVVVKAEDCFNIFPDPKTRRYDWNQDARYICRAKWVDADYAKELYPKKKNDVDRLFTDASHTQLSDVDKLRGEAYVDYKRKRIRLVEDQYKKFEDVTKYVFSDGKVMQEDQVNAKLLDMAKQAGITYETKDDREEHVCIGVFCDGVLFEHGVSKRKRFSFVPYFSNRKKNGAPYSMITTAIPIQDAINKRESKALALLTMNQARYEKGAVADKTDLAVQMVRPDGQIELEEGFFDRFVMDKNLELAQSQHAMHLASKLDFRQVTGVNPDALGEKSEMRSGVGVQRKIAMTGMIIAPVFDNFKRTREALAKTIHDAVTIAYTQQKVMTITDNPKLTRSVVLSNEDLNAIKQTQYDVIISEESDFETVQEQQLDILTRSLPQMLQFGPGWAEVMLEMSSIRDKDVIMQKIKQVAQENKQPNKPNIALSAAMDKLTAVERAFFYQEMGAPPQLIQQVLQSSPPPTQVLQAQGTMAGHQVAAHGQAASVQASAIDAQTQQQTSQLKLAQGAQQLQNTAAKTQAEIANSKMDMAKGMLELEQKRMENAGVQVGQQ